MKINDLHRHLRAPPDLYWTWFSVALFFWVAFNGANNELPKTNASNFCICNFFSDLHLFISTFSFLSKNSKTFHIGLPLKRHLKHKNINFESGCSHVHLGKSVRIAQVIHMHTLRMVTSTELFYIPRAFCSHVSCLSACVCVCASLMLTRVELYTVKSSNINNMQIRGRNADVDFSCDKDPIWECVRLMGENVYVQSFRNIQLRVRAENSIQSILNGEMMELGKKSRETFYDEWWHMRPLTQNDNENRRFVESH